MCNSWKWHSFPLNRLSQVGNFFIVQTYVSFRKKIPVVPYICFEQKRFLSSNLNSTFYTHSFRRIEKPTKSTVDHRRVRVTISIVFMASFWAKRRNLFLLQLDVLPSIISAEVQQPACSPCSLTINTILWCYTCYICCPWLLIYESNQCECAAHRF